MSSAADAPAPPTRRRSERAARPGGIGGLSLVVTLLFLIPPLLLALYAGLKILLAAEALWQWPWGLFFLAVALCPLLIVAGRAGLREEDAPRRDLPS